MSVRRVMFLFAVPAFLWAAHAVSYPLDGYERTRIGRLLGYRMVLDGKVPGSLRVPAGGRLGMADIKLRLQGINENFDISDNTPKDPALQAALEKLFSSRDPSYGIVLLDITDPRKPRYAALRENEKRIPGSVGKLLVATGFLDALRLRFPDDTAARERFLRETKVAGGSFVHRDGKTVPFFQAGDAGVVKRRLEADDSFSLWEWLDHMLSVSSNAAGSVTWKQALLLRRWKERYPLSAEAEKAYLSETSRAKLSDFALQTLEAPLRDAGLSTDRLRLGTFFTRNASSVIPGRGSYGCPSELMRWLIRMEQGRLVDAWSSLELKRLLYFSRPRYRYASSPALNDAAVFFKSGSLFKCREEEGFTCRAYAGNELNLMHSVAVVESVDKVYFVTMMSNVLRVNSAVEHQSVGGEIERLIQSLAAAP